MVAGLPVRDYFTCSYIQYRWLETLQQLGIVVVKLWMSYGSGSILFTHVFGRFARLFERSSGLSSTLFRWHRGDPKETSKAESMYYTEK